MLFQNKDCFLDLDVSQLMPFLLLYGCWEFHEFKKKNL